MLQHHKNVVILTHMMRVTLKPFFAYNVVFQVERSQAKHIKKNSLLDTSFFYFQGLILKL